MSHRVPALLVCALLSSPIVALAQPSITSDRVASSLGRALAGDSGALATVEQSDVDLEPRERLQPLGDQSLGPAPRAALQPGEFTPTTESRRHGNAAKSFLTDVGRDYAAWFTLDSARTLAIGSALALAAHTADGSVRDGRADGLFQNVGQVSSGGQQYGNLTMQVPLAVGWWAVGSAMGNGRHAEAGRDLVRAQISAMSWTYALKYAVGRTRPNGDVRSFPSGHTSATFATATVLQRHYGWKAGLPFYALGAFTGASRIADDKHWTSDVIMGAVVGVTAGRAVTMRMGTHRLEMSPGAAPGGGVMMNFSVK